MQKSSFCFLRSIALILCWALFVSNTSLAEQPRLSAVTAKQSVEKIGVGKKAKLKEADGKTLRGKIISIGDKSCVVESGPNPPVTVAYTELTSVGGPGLSKGAKIGIGVGIGLAVTAIVVAVVVKRNLNRLDNLKVPLY